MLKKEYTSDELRFVEEYIKVGKYGKVREQFRVVGVEEKGRKQIKKDYTSDYCNVSLC